jgi:hypothetical protein
VTTKLPSDLSFAPLGGEARELHAWLTTFHLASVVLDPYTNESSWVLKTAIRILDDLRGSHARVNFIVTADEADTKRFLGPIACPPSHSSASTARSWPQPRAGAPPRGARSPRRSPPPPSGGRR